MKPVLHTDLTHATAIDSRGHGRTPAVRLMVDERDHYLREAAAFYPGLSDRETARQLRTALAAYRAGRWRRDRAETKCPSQYRGRLPEALWLLLRTLDAVPGDRTIRAALARSADPTTCCPEAGA